jgi:hypothetical protein
MNKAIRLRVKGGVDLDGYLFTDNAHAVEWLRQPWVTDEEYAVEEVTVRIAPCCGRRVARKVLRRMSVSEFLSEAQAA